MSIQVYAWRSLNAFNSASTTYQAISNGRSNSTGEELGGHQPWSAPGTLRNLKVEVPTAPGSGKSWTCTIRINGSDSGVTCTIADTDTSASDASNSVTVAAGDTVSLKVVPSGTPTNSGAPYVSCDFESDNDGESVYGAPAAGTSGSPWYIAPFSGTNAVATATAATETVPIDGTIGGTWLRLSSVFGSGGYTFAWYLNGVKQDGAGGTVNTAVSISAGGTTASGTYSLPVVAGDEVYIEVTKTLSPPTVGYAILFTADTPGQSIYAGGSGNSPATNVAQYMYPGQATGQTWSATEADFIAKAGLTDFILGKMYLRATTAPGSGKSYALSLRKNSADPSSGPVVSLVDSATTGNDTLGAASYTNGETLSMESTPTGSPTSSTFRWSLAMSVVATIRATAIFGEGATVNSSRTFVANMDAVSRTLNLPNTVYIAPNLTIPETGSAPTATANTARIWAEDNGSGKTRLMVQFGSGAAQQIAIEP